MKYRFSLFRLMLAVLVFAILVVLFGDISPAVAFVIGASAAGACLIGKPKELGGVILTIVAALAYLVFIIFGSVWFIAYFEFGQFEIPFILALFVLAPYIVAVLVRIYTKDSETPK